MSYHAPKGVYLDQQTGRYVTAEDFVPEEAIGVDIFAQRNLLNLSFYGKRAPGHDIVFEPDARDNTIFAFNLPNGVTNRATIPTNRIIPNWPVGFDVSTPPVSRLRGINNEHNPLYGANHFLNAGHGVKMDLDGCRKYPADLPAKPKLGG